MASIQDVHGLFSQAPGYLNTASLGVPPRPVVDAVRTAVGQWQHGHVGAEWYDGAIVRSRAGFARLIGVEPARVAVGATVSGLIGLVAASLPDGAEVLVADGDFTSVLFPFAAQQRRGVVVRSVPLAELAGAVTGSTALVAVSLVQSADGTVLDLDALRRAARAHGAATLIDVTQACGWLPVDARDLDYCVGAAYKWLLSPRGTAFLAVHPDRLDALLPNSASWYGGADIPNSYYGLPLRLSTDARRLDTSPAWLSWVGTEPALELVESVGVEAIHRHNVGLANRLRAGLGLPEGQSAIVSVPLGAEARARLTAAGVRMAERAGRVRFSCHLYTTEADVDLALDAASGS